MSKQRPCPDCQSEGKFVFMLYSPKNMYYICPECKGVFTPAPADDMSAVKMVEDEITKLMREKYKSNLPAKDPIPAGRAAQGGGSRSSKKHGDREKLKRKSLNQLYKEL